MDLNISKNKVGGYLRLERMSIKKELILLSMVCVWLGLVWLGETSLLKYDFRPGTHSHSPNIWPANSQIKRNENLPTLVMFAHPKCPCTRASIGELAKLMAHSQGKLWAYVLFTAPENTLDHWVKTDLWESAARIPGVQVAIDTNGQEAHYFDSITSGQTLLYDSQGHLLFSGGITDSRGHSGDNRGRAMIESFLAGKVLSGLSKHTPVFGCFLVQQKSSNVSRSS